MDNISIETVDTRDGIRPVSTQVSAGESPESALRSLITRMVYGRRWRLTLVAGQGVLCVRPWTHDDNKPDVRQTLRVTLSEIKRCVGNTVHLGAAREPLTCSIQG